MARRKLNYRAGDWFAVPLEGSRYCLGRVARIGSGAIILGYFFRGRYERLPTCLDTRDLNGFASMLVARFGGLHILSGRWPLVCSDGQFNPAEWPVPHFGHRSLILKDTFVEVEYSETLSEVGRFLVSEERWRTLHEDGLAGAEWMESRLEILME